MFRIIASEFGGNTVQFSIVSLSLLLAAFDGGTLRAEWPFQSVYFEGG